MSIENMSHENTKAAIDGAIAYGRLGINPPPSDDHWLAEYWRIGKQLAAPVAQQDPAKRIRDLEIERDTLAHGVRLYTDRIDDLEKRLAAAVAQQEPIAYDAAALHAECQRVAHNAIHDAIYKIDDCEPVKAAVRDALDMIDLSAYTAPVAPAEQGERKPDEPMELTKIAELIVRHYADKPDDFTTSIGDWEMRDDFGLPSFGSYLRIPLGDWRKYANDA